MSRIITFLRGLIRGVKKHMEAVFIAIGIFSMTGGFYLMFEQPQYKIWGVGIAIFGLILVLIGYIGTYIRDKRERQKRLEERVQEQLKWATERMESHKLFESMIKGQKDIVEELKKLNQDKENKENKE